MDIRSIITGTRAGAHLLTPRTLVWNGLLCATAIALLFAPLFNLLAYGFAFVMALIGSIAALDLGAMAARRWRDQPPGDRVGADLVRHFVHVGGAHLLMLIPPAAVISLNAVWVRNCDWAFGLKAYLLMTCLSVLFATAVGLFLGIAGGRRRWLQNALPYLTVLGFVVWSVWQFYVTPPVFSYNPLVGYFPGNLYDVDIDLGSAFYWARALHLSTAVALLAAVALLFDSESGQLAAPRLKHLRRRPAATVVFALGCLSSGLLWSHSGELGFAVDADDIAEHLGGRHETEHFIIFHPRTGEIADAIDVIAADHEFRYSQSVAALGVAPTKKITSFYFASASEKATFIGARNVYMAKPWRGEIYVHHLDSPHQVLRHEIAHVVAAEFGDPIFGVSAHTILGVPAIFNVGMIEGLAVAVDWPDHFNRPLTPHQSVKAMYELRNAPPITRVLSTGFLAFSSARSYTVAGSFVRFLLDDYGAKALRTLYRSGGDFGRAYGKDQSVLVAEWNQMIEGVELPASSAQVVQERFRSGGVFERPCPHAVARERLVVAHLVADGRFDDAIARWRRTCDAVPGEPSYLLELAGLFNRAERYPEARAIYRRLGEDEAGITATLRVEALLDLVRIAAKEDDRETMEAVLAQAIKIPMDADRQRNVEAQRLTLAHGGPAGDSLRNFFWRDSDGDRVEVMAGLAEAVYQEPNNAFVHYLIGRVLRGRGAARQVVVALKRALDLGLPTELLTRECAKMLAEAGFVAGDLDAVQQGAEILTQSNQPLVMRLYGEDWLQRIKWTKTGSL